MNFSQCCLGLPGSAALRQSSHRDSPNAQETEGFQTPGPVAPVARVVSSLVFLTLRGGGSLTCRNQADRGTSCRRNLETLRSLTLRQSTWLNCPSATDPSCLFQDFQACSREPRSIDYLQHFRASFCGAGKLDTENSQICQASRQVGSPGLRESGSPRSQLVQESGRAGVPQFWSSLHGGATPEPWQATEEPSK